MVRPAYNRKTKEPVVVKMVSKRNKTAHEMELLWREIIISTVTTVFTWHWHCA